MAKGSFSTKVFKKMSEELLVAGIIGGTVKQIDLDRYDPPYAGVQACIKLFISDRDRQYAKDVIDSDAYRLLFHVQDGDPWEFSDDEYESPSKVKRPSTSLTQIDIADECNLRVSINKQSRTYQLSSACVVCGREFEAVVPNFNTRDIVVQVHRIGYELGRHQERHRSYQQYLAELQAKGDSADAN